MSLLQGEPQYGLKILDRLRAEAGLELAEGSLYPLLHRLEKLGLIAAEWRLEDGASHPRKYYTLTGAGRANLSDIQAIWFDMSDRFNSFLRRDI